MARLQAQQYPSAGASGLVSMPQMQTMQAMPMPQYYVGQPYTMMTDASASLAMAPTMMMATTGASTIAAASSSADVSSVVGVNVSTTAAASSSSSTLSASSQLFVPGALPAAPVSQAAPAVSSVPASAGKAASVSSGPPSQPLTFAAAAALPPKPVIPKPQPAPAAAAPVANTSSAVLRQLFGTQDIRRDASYNAEDRTAVRREPRGDPREPRKLCKYFNMAEGCRNGDSCTFLHSRSAPVPLPSASHKSASASRDRDDQEHHSRPARPSHSHANANANANGDDNEASRPHNYRTVTCRFWRRGDCHDGDRCNFLHEEKEDKSEDSKADGAGKFQKYNKDKRSKSESDDESDDDAEEVDEDGQRRPRKPRFCRYFNLPGGCTRGDECHFVHEKRALRPPRVHDDSAAAARPSKGPRPPRKVKAAADGSDHEDDGAGDDSRPSVSLSADRVRRIFLDSLHHLQKHESDWVLGSQHGLAFRDRQRAALRAIHSVSVVASSSSSSDDQATPDDAQRPSKPQLPRFHLAAAAETRAQLEAEGIVECSRDERNGAILRIKPEEWSRHRPSSSAAVTSSSSTSV